MDGCLSLQIVELLPPTSAERVKFDRFLEMIWRFRYSPLKSRLQLLFSIFDLDGDDLLSIEDARELVTVLNESKGSADRKFDVDTAAESLLYHISGGESATLDQFYKFMTSRFSKHKLNDLFRLVVLPDTLKPKVSFLNSYPTFRFW